jgi:hypothetical protein
MRRIPTALVALTVAAALVVVALPASAAGPRSFKAFSRTVRAGQQVKVFGTGCRSQGLVRIYLNGVEIDTDRADRNGQFVDHVVIPSSADLGEHRLKAGCNGFGLGSVTITVRGSRFDVQPRRVEAGENIIVTGKLCRPGSYVTIRLGNRLIGDGRVNGSGKFRVTAEVPSNTSEDSHQVSARCHGRFVGVVIIVIIIIYPSPSSLLTTDRTAVPAGQAVTVRGTSCPSGVPMASLDAKPVDLNVGRSPQGKGFTASVTVPASVTPGKHTLRAGCEAGSSGTTELHVLNATTPAAARMTFGSQPTSDLVLWAGLISGLALLIASVGITTRRRRF